MTKKAQITLLHKTFNEIVSFCKDYDVSALNKEKEEIVKLIEEIKTYATTDTKYLQNVKKVAIETKKSISLKIDELEKKEFYSDKFSYAS
ncbi:hypothetical protein [Sulfurimonas sp.]|uniref:hypothetical protein n=1 Tax=Sulfurimonas sp. TaxID=2022749 RepID=UPI0025E4DC30|nr:hypothetical protein [Sulfurimonas sp.]MBW6487527.1 hypothetical protein [Sulfurimonas sp.]